MRYLNFKKKEGFTLVELLVVIAIIAMLSVTSIAGFTQYRRTALLDFAVDSITSQMYAFKDKSLHTNQCYKVVFDEGIKGFSGEYSKLKVPDGVLILNLDDQKWKSEGCTESIYKEVRFEIDDKITIVSITDDKGSVLSDLSMEFEPPNGKIIASTTDGELSDNEDVVIVLRYGEADLEKYTRTIKINLLNGQIDKKQ